MFEPDGSGTSFLLWGAGLALLIVFAIAGHRLGARGWRHALGRAGTVAATALCLVLAATASLNHTYGWYTSWSDLASGFTGSHPQGVGHTYGAAPTSVATYDRAAAQRINTAADVKFAAQRRQFTKDMKLSANAPNGQWIKVNVPGLTATGHDIGRVMIWLPPGYVTHPDRTYPVIEAFHGIPGGTLDYERVFFLDKVVRRAQAEHHLRDAVIVVPQEMPGGVDTECVDGGGLNEETWLTRMVPDYVVRHVRVQADMHSWATVGVSAGGWCSMMAGLLHPDRYAAMASLGGYFKPDFSGSWNPFKGQSVPQRYDLMQRVRTAPTHQALWVLVSGGDKLSGKASEEFVRAVRAPTVLTTVDYPGAGHRVDVWQRAMPDVMTWLGRSLPAFAWSAAESAPSTSAASTSETASSTTSPATSRSTTPTASVHTSVPGAVESHHHSLGVTPSPTASLTQPVIPSATAPLTPQVTTPVVEPTRG